MYLYRCSCPEVFCKKGVLRNFAKFTGKRLCQGLFLIKLHALSNFAKFTQKHLCQSLIKLQAEALAQVFSCEFCEICKNNFSYRTPLVAAFCLYRGEILTHDC